MEISSFTYNLPANGVVDSGLFVKNSQLNTQK